MYKIEVVNYLNKFWTEIFVYLEDCNYPIDENNRERLMKPVCIGRKNYLFCGLVQAVKNSSLICSIIKSCKINGFRPVEYIANFLQKLVSEQTDYTALHVNEYCKII